MDVDVSLQFSDLFLSTDFHTGFKYFGLGVCSQYLASTHWSPHGKILLSLLFLSLDVFACIPNVLTILPK